MRRASLIDEKARQFRITKVAAGRLVPELKRLRGALLMVLSVLRTLLMVSLLPREQVPGNQTCQLVDHWRFVLHV